MIGESLKTVLLNTLNDVSVKTGLMFGVLTFDTIKEVFSVQVINEQANNIFSRVHEIIFNIRDNKVDSVINTKKDNSIVSIAEELKALKELLDTGILTEDEFNEQKAKMLSRS
ncbi:SHOCT domain-containing protein [Tissierella praeacuta]|uniref:SHOCT domain-containing protein n=1 Tax=Tissierella praeacuta TaxID=43131 RepID=UPI0028AAC33C|nr:SHOCT domain-containing protein [Tissierella praeacuta]